MKRASRFLSTLAILGLFTACGDSGGSSGDTMTVDELDAVLDVLVEPLFAAVFGSSPTAPPFMAAAAVPVQESFECDGGGV